MTAPKKKADAPPLDAPVGVPDRFYVAEKDPNYAYRWCHTADRIQYEREYQGWEIDPDQPTKTPVGTLPAGQVSPTPGGTVGLRRGDLVLMRMPKDTFEQRLAGPKRRARDAQETTADTEAERLNEQFQSQLRGLGYKHSGRKRMVFNEAADPTITTRE